MIRSKNATNHALQKIPTNARKQVNFKSARHETCFLDIVWLFNSFFSIEVIFQGGILPSYQNQVSFDNFSFAGHYPLRFSSPLSYNVDV